MLFINFGVPMESEASELPKCLVLGRCGMLQSTPLRGPTSSSTHFRPGIGFDTKLSHPGPGPHHNPGSTPP
ncbi:hypothetical protein ACFX1Z_035214 [Malus domestica]